MTTSVRQTEGDLGWKLRGGVPADPKVDAGVGPRGKFTGAPRSGTVDSPDEHPRPDQRAPVLVKTLNPNASHKAGVKLVPVGCLVIRFCELQFFY